MDQKQWAWPFARTRWRLMRTVMNEFKRTSPVNAAGVNFNFLAELRLAGEAGAHAHA
jgi:hypothetical protein